MEEKHIYFVRHGESESNVDDIYRGAAALLTGKGREQAAAMAQQIALTEPTTLLVSDFPRALDTAAAIAKVTGLSPEQQEVFREWREPTVIFGKHRDDAEAREILTHIQTATDADYRYSNEENFAELMTRAHTALTFLEEHDAPRICVVTHGGFLRVLLGNILFGDSFTHEHFIKSFKIVPMYNTGITHIVSRPEHRWELISWNDHKHLSQGSSFALEAVHEAEQLR